MQASQAFATKWLLRKAVLSFLQTMVAKKTAIAIAKWVPIAGTAIAGGAGFSLASYAGTQMLEDAKATAIEINQAILRSSNEHQT